MSRHYDTSPKAAGSNHDEVIGFIFSMHVILPDALWPWG
jgi:hypothetical protein